MKLPRSDVWIRGVERSRRGLERLFHARSPRDAYSQVLLFGPFHFREVADVDSGRAGEVWEEARRAAVIAAHDLLLSAREAALDLLLSRFPLAVPPSSAPRDPKTGLLRFKVTGEALRFQVAWHDVVWSLLAGLLASGEPPEELRDLPQLQDSRQVPPERVAEAAGARNFAPPCQAGDILHRHLLLEKTVPIFALLGPGSRLSARYDPLADLLAGWMHSSPLTRIEHLEVLGSHPLFKEKSWPGMKALLDLPFLDGPLLVGRALAELEEKGSEPFSQAWLDMALEILRSCDPPGGPPRTAAALFRALSRAHALRGGIEKSWEGALAAARSNRFRPLVSLAGAVMGSPSLVQDWSAPEQSALAILASGGSPVPAAATHGVHS